MFSAENIEGVSEVITEKVEVITGGGNKTERRGRGTRPGISDKERAAKVYEEMREEHTKRNKVELSLNHNQGKSYVQINNEQGMTVRRHDASHKRGQILVLNRS